MYYQATLASWRMCSIKLLEYAKEKKKEEEVRQFIELVNGQEKNHYPYTTDMLLTSTVIDVSVYGASSYNSKNHTPLVNLRLNLALC